MRITIDALCHKGLVRENNEDALSIGGYVLRDDTASLNADTPENGSFYLLVSDGMGGHEDGEVASMFTFDVIKEKFSQHLITENNFEEDMLVLIRDISARLNRMAADKGQLRPMGCTLTGVVWHYGHAWLINAGDSRTYRFRGGILGQLTTDETERGVTGNPNASKLLLNCIGGGCEGYLTVTSLDDRLFEDDVLLICSDGLTDMVSEEQIETAIGAGATAADLYRMACEGGGVDNVSVILARLS